MHRLVTDIVPGAHVDLDEDGLWLEIRSQDHSEPGAVPVPA